MVYKVNPPNYSDPSDSKHCNWFLYMYAFWYVTATIVVVIMAVITVLCIKFAKFRGNNRNKK